MSSLEDYRFVVLHSVERARRNAESLTGGDAYNQGRRMAYFEILERILESAETVGLTAADVGMEGFDPGQLIGLQSARAA